MEIPGQNITNLLFEYAQWKRELYFWQNELERIYNRLGELTTRYTSLDVLSMLEYYQNDFILHGSDIEELLVAIQEFELNMAGHISAGNVRVEPQLAVEHAALMKRMEVQRKIGANLKMEFYRFLSKYDAICP